MADRKYNRAQREFGSVSTAGGDSQTGTGDNSSEGNEQELANAPTENNAAAEQHLENVVAPSTSSGTSSQINPGSTGDSGLPDTPLNVFLRGRIKYLTDPKKRTKSLAVIEGNLRKIRDLSDDEMRNVLTDRWTAKATKLLKLAMENSVFKKIVGDESQKLADMMKNRKLKIFTDEQLHFLECWRVDFLENLGAASRSNSRTQQAT